MPHSHHHHDPGKDQTVGRLWMSIALNTGIVVVEFAGGLISGSLALLSDALHNLGDTTSLIVSLAARKIAGKRADKNKTFGYKRAEIIGAFINLIVLIIISIFLIKAAVDRFLHPGSVNGELMYIIGIIAAVGNFGVVFLLAQGSKGSLNIKSAYIHFLADGLASFGVFIGGLLILFFNFTIADPILTLVIAGYIIWQSYLMLRETIDILMESTPEEIDVNYVAQCMQSVEGVRDVHHIHVWRLDEHHILLESHVMTDQKNAEQIESIKKELKTLLLTEFDIDHTTLEFEWKPCEKTLVIPQH
jgi:cobalt-zinc-cadmium efflux system protein